MNPIPRIRSAATAVAAKVRGAWRTSWDGTKRTASWVKTGVTGNIRRAWLGIGRLPERAKEGGASASESIRDRAGGVADRTGLSRLTQSARSNSLVAVAWATAAILILAWIGWAVYVTIENGANAGLGVVISWPAALAALAIIAAPFVGAWLLVRRLRGDESTPAIAGGGQLSESEEDDEAVTGGTYPG